MFDLFKRKKKILVVEDEPDILSSLKARLEFEGFEVCVAEDGEAAFDAGATDFLNKPFTTERLMTKIHKLLNLDPYQPK